MTERLSLEGAGKAVKDARWAEGIGIAYAAVSVFMLPNIHAPAEIRAVAFAGFIASGINAARRSSAQRSAMEKFPGIEQA